MGRKFIEPSETEILTYHEGVRNEDLRKQLRDAEERRVEDGSVIYLSLEEVFKSLLNQKIKVLKIAAVITDANLRSIDDVDLYVHRNLADNPNITRDTVKWYIDVGAQMWAKGILISPREYGLAVASRDFCRQQGYYYLPTFAWRHSVFDIPFVAENDCARVQAKSE